MSEEVINKVDKSALDKIRKLIEQEIKEINPKVSVKCVPIDLAKTTDYSAVT